MRGPFSDSGVRRIIAAVVLVIAGFVLEKVWPFGIGAWFLITAGLLEMIYRP
ncbi:hypothetical protein [Streptomyces radiopugnans]|uniref:DUF2892 domain-containing protein n=1 Tax=Streptomyces radiopugnans TaxID=403935 RepID=A0A1H9JB71_9ACTN|nr:hypothetical protein [Streptomyces radiopugnans]SEQ84033.1 hypothetical protein SAMN05216481_1173 [Streptomyces radiopugnans]